jgi:hypothetical protein
VKLSPSIFDSNSEREVFKALEQRWSERLRLYPQLPLSKIVVIEPSDHLSSGERRTFYGTNVDYTFCDLTDRPRFSIEFDGIGHGFDHAGEYRQVRPTKDPHRKLKLDFKLRVTRGLGYPLVIVSFEELEALDASESLTILDGIVARLVVMQEYPRLVEELVEDEAENLAALDREAAHELAQDLVLQAEVQTEIENDPLERARWEAEMEASRYGAGTPYGATWLYDPPLPDSDGAGPFGISPEVLRQRIEGFNRAERVGCRATVGTPMGDVTRVVWMRNVGRDIGLMMEQVAENAALMLAFRQAAAMMSEHVDRA